MYSLKARITKNEIKGSIDTQHLGWDDRKESAERWRLKVKILSHNI